MEGMQDSSYLEAAVSWLFFVHVAHKKGTTIRRSYHLLLKDSL